MNRSGQIFHSVALCLGLVACSSADGDTAGGDGDGDGDTLGTGGTDNTPGTGGSGGTLPNTGGSNGTGGATASGGTLGSGGTEGNTGGAPTGGSNGTGGLSDTSGGPRTMGYLGCSMSDNVASGYVGIGGERLWPSLPAYWGQVVQSWANPNHTVWNTFDAQIDEFGVPTAVWVMVCIFAQNGVTIDEMRDIVENVRERAPDATIYVTGQPLYTDGHVCSAAGATGPQLTDDMAQQVAEDPSLTNIEYGGTFILTPAGTEADTCHANAAGRESLGEQAADKWGL